MVEWGQTVFTVNFAEIMTTMLLDKTYGFNSGVLARLFNTLFDQLRQDEPPNEPGWMMQAWLDIVNRAQAPELDQEELFGDEPEDELKHE